MTSYRRRFVAYSMGLIGFVLLAAFIALGIYQYKTQLRELEKTMSLVSEPWETDDGFRPNGRPADSGELHLGPQNGDMPEGEMPGNKPDDKPDEKPDGPRGDKPERKVSDEGILTLYYDSQTEEITVLSNRFGFDETELPDAVKEIVGSGKDFGKLKSSSLIYRREATNGGYKIAIADKAYITSRTLRNSLLLGAVFIGAMALLLPVSIGLSKLASKPLEKAMDMERQFVQDISHDLKTPVTVVLANNSILRSNPEATVAEQQQWIDSTDDAAKNMMELVNQMLTLASLEAAEKKSAKAGGSELVRVNLTSCAEKCILQMESVAYDRGVELTTDIGENVTGLGEAAGVEKIMSGLIENALKYEPDGGRVEVTLSRNRKKARFTVRNYGSFISDEDLEHIFERFYRGDKARSEKGHGLGLPILKGTAELMGAELTVSSSKENGTVFTAIFDAAEAEK